MDGDTRLRGVFTCADSGADRSCLRRPKAPLLDIVDAGQNDATIKIVAHIPSRLYLIVLHKFPVFFVRRCVDKDVLVE